MLCHHISNCSWAKPALGGPRRCFRYFFRISVFWESLPVQTQLRLISRMDIDNPTFDVVMGILQQNWALLDDEISEVRTGIPEEVVIFWDRNRDILWHLMLVGLKTPFWPFAERLRSFPKWRNVWQEHLSPHFFLIFLSTNTLQIADSRYIP